MNQILKVVVSKLANPQQYSVKIDVSAYDGSELLILKIAQNYYFPELSAGHDSYSFVITGALQGINFSASTQMTFIRYDYNREKIVGAQRGLVTFDQVASSQVVALTSTVETDSSAWRNGALVEKIEGPYQDGARVEKLDLQKPAYYLATPNSPNLAPAQLLSIKWEYQYNKGAYASFKNSKRSVFEDGGVKKCRIDCSFHNLSDTLEVAMYAFFRGRSTTVMTSCKTNNSSAESPTPTENIPDPIPDNSGSGTWHDPIKNPMCTLYMQSGGGGEAGKHWGLFGTTRNGGVHQGLDFFAVTGTPIFACVDGTVYNRQWHGGYGNTITIKVKDRAAFLARKRNYTLQYPNQGEIAAGANWTENGNIFLFYAHLDSVNEFNFGDPVSSGTILGKTGRSGVTGGTCAPHLHFEIFCDYTMAVGTKFRVNPALFIQYKGYKEQSEAERKSQADEAKKGKQPKENGSAKLVHAPMKNFKK